METIEWNEEGYYVRLDDGVWASIPDKNALATSRERPVAWYETKDELKGSVPYDIECIGALLEVLIHESVVFGISSVEHRGSGDWTAVRVIRNSILWVIRNAIGGEDEEN